MTIEPNDPTLEEASARLAQMEAEDTAATDATAATKPEAGSATQEPTAPAQGKEGQVHSTAANSNEPGAPATEEPNKPAEQATKPAEEGSEFAKNQARLQGGWNKLNSEKKALQKERYSIEASRQEFAAKQKEFDTQRQQASKPKYTPEEIEQTAAQYDKQADQLDANSDFDGAVVARHKAKELRAYAKDLRDHPPAAPITDKASEDKFQADQKQWWAKAYTDYPLAGSPNSAVALTIKSLVTPPGKEGHDPAKFDPEISKTVLQTDKGLYYVARLVTAETSAARVPILEKEAVELRAKVKELEGKLAIPGDQIATQLGKAKPDSEKSDEELEAELQTTAAQMDRRF